jgi:hypothetical protein
MAVSVEKISVAIAHEELEWARARAEREGTSVSAVLSDAARAARKLEAVRARQALAWDAFLEWATDGKGLSPEALEAAALELDGK